MDEARRASIADNFRSTELGFLRIKKNLKLEGYSDFETERYLRDIIRSTDVDRIQTRGQNHYFECPRFNAVLTIHSRSLTVITAKPLLASKPSL